MGDGVRGSDRILAYRDLLGSQRRPWEAYFAVVYAITVTTVEADRLAEPSRAVASAALAAIVPWYLFAVRPLLLRTDRQPLSVSLGAPASLAILVVLFAAVQSQSTNAWILAFALTPICLMVTTVAWGMGFVVLLNVVAAVLTGIRNPNPGLGGALNVLGIVVFSIASAYLFSRWLARVVAQSEERAVLIEQLESTRMELAAAHRESGVLAERHRLASEIHDTLAQGFTSIITTVQAATVSLQPDSPALPHLQLALETARENLSEARTLVAGLSPRVLGEGSLAEALRRAADSTAPRGGVLARSEVSGTPRELAMGIEVVLLRVCQEALANVRRHAAATQVDVRLHYGEDSVELAVADDGRGFDRAAVNGGYGLRGMRDRVRQAGGTLEVITSPGAGTVVRAEIPG